MDANQELFPPTTTKVNMNTSQDINDRIQKEIKENIDLYKRGNRNEIEKRLTELEYEWDTERVLEINFALITLLSSIKGLAGKKRWLALSGIASIFMIQHSLQGWCPPLPIIRKLGIRTATEINHEKMELQKILEDEALQS